MTSQYYTGDGVPLKFLVTDSDGAVNPSACDVLVLKPDNETCDSCTAAIDANEVSCNVGGSVTDKGGLYKVYFVLTLPSGLERTHKIEFTVVNNPEENR